jgi:DNA (cytosine-5)-methyltransferase 1
MREFYTVDLFCGAGGASTGLELALSRLKMRHKGLAINHWSVAVDTMKRNHPDIDTKQMGIEEAVPADLVPSGEVDLLWASPSCTHHSRAKGGKPRSNQLRAQPELVLTWLDQLFVRRIIIENVPEFVDWGPLTKDGKPIERLKGSCFRSWVASIEARHYAVEWRVVNCADYGDATSRRRFFLKAVRKGCGRIRWPEPTHAENPQPDLFGHELKKWRGVRECLDLSDTGKSIFNREKPLAENTLRRIMVGLRKYNGLDFQMDMLGAGENDETRVLPTTAPLRTQHTANRTAIVRPFIVRMNRHCTAESVDAPISVITTSGAHHMLCQPLILDHFKDGEAKPPDAPMPAQTTHDRFSMITPYLITEQANNAPRGIDKPLRAQTTVRKDYLCTPLVLGQQGGAQARPIEEPCPTIATSGAVRMITPLVIDMSHPGDPNDERRVTGGNEPMRTITTRNNSAMVALPVLEDGRIIDIRIRMLKPSELAAAHSFPPDYVLTGNRGEQVKQIGNSVPVMTAAAMCEADFREVG